MAPLVKLARKPTGAVQQEAKPAEGSEPVEQQPQQHQEQQEQRQAGELEGQQQQQQHTQQLESNLQGLCVVVEEEWIIEEGEVLFVENDVDLTPKACYDEGGQGCLWARLQAGLPPIEWPLAWPPARLWSSLAWTRDWQTRRRCQHMRI